MPIDLKALRQRVGLTAAEVARRMRISDASLARIEKQAEWKFSTLVNYLRSLGRTVTLTITADDVTAEIVDEDDGTGSGR